MFRNLAVALMLFTVVGLGAAQSASDRGRKSDEVLAKMYKLDLLNQILPVLMTKEQLKKILPPIEKARQKIVDVEKAEYEDLLRMEAKIDPEIKNGMEKGVVPPRELMLDIYNLMKASGARRAIIAFQNTDSVYTVFVSTLNAGQKKAAANSLNPKQFDPSAKVDEMTDEQKLRLYVREILLHPLAYDMLAKLSM